MTDKDYDKYYGEPLYDSDDYDNDDCDNYADEDDDDGDWADELEYPGDEEHIRWKLGLLEQAAKFDIPAYRKILQSKNMPGGSPV